MWHEELNGAAVCTFDPRRLIGLVCGHASRRTAGWVAEGNLGLHLANDGSHLVAGWRMGIVRILHVEDYGLLHAFAHDIRRWLRGCWCGCRSSSWSEQRRLGNHCLDNWSRTKTRGGHALPRGGVPSIIARDGYAIEGALGTDTSLLYRNNTIAQESRKHKRLK